MTPERSFTLTESAVAYGRIVVPQRLRPLFPDSQGPVKVTLLLDEKDEGIQRTYNGKWHLIYGLNHWFEKHNASKGDKVVMLNAGKNKIRLKFKKREANS